MRAYEIIRKKRDGGTLDAVEIEFLINGHLGGAVPDYQMSAFLMAVCIKGMDKAETLAMTRAMLNTGTTLDLSDITGKKVDKHSTGGVGDKTSIILAPLLAAMGVKVPMVSGRGLGHTGGTLDKLESIPGLRTDLSVDEFKENLKTVDFAMMGQTDEMAPADKKLYALRDVTATVESIPLIASSIMSKKLAEGAEALVFDVKTGSGAFLSNPEDSRTLARTLVEIAEGMGVKAVAVLTNMDQPLGKTVGNSLEIKECLSALRGTAANDLKEVTLTLAAWMLNMADCLSDETHIRKLTGHTLANYRKEAEDFIIKGDAFKKFVQFIDAQHGDPEVAFKPFMLPATKHNKQIMAWRDGFVTRLDARAVGVASVLLGAGRDRVSDEIDPGAGIILAKKMGEKVKKGEPMAMLYYNDDAGLKEAEELLLGGIRIDDNDPVMPPLIQDIIIAQ